MYGATALLRKSVRETQCVCKAKAAQRATIRGSSLSAVRGKPIFHRSKFRIAI